MSRDELLTSRLLRLLVVEFVLWWNRKSEAICELQPLTRRPFLLIENIYSQSPLPASWGRHLSYFFSALSSWEKHLTHFQSWKCEAWLSHMSVALPELHLLRCPLLSGQHGKAWRRYYWNISYSIFAFIILWWYFSYASDRIKLLCYFTNQTLWSKKTDRQSENDYKYNFQNKALARLGETALLDNINYLFLFYLFIYLDPQPEIKKTSIRSTWSPLSLVTQTDHVIFYSAS